MKKWFAALALALLASGCGSEDPEQTPDFLAPAALDEHVVYIATDPAEAYLLHAATLDPEPVAERVAITKNPILWQRRKSSDNELLILSRGDGDPDEGAPIPPALTVLGPDGVSRVYELKTAFDRLVQSDDGRFVTAMFAPNGQAAQDSLLFTETEVAIIDLSLAPGENNPVQRNLHSSGEAPRDVVFSPPMDLAGKQRRLLLGVFPTMVSLIDLLELQNDPDRSELTVALAQGSQRSIELEQVRFDLTEAKVYLRGRSSSDVYVVQLSESSNTINDFDAALNQLGAGIAVHDMTLYELDGERRLLVAAGNQALVIEANTNTVTQVPLDQSVTQTLLFDGTSPRDPDVEPRALLYSPGARAVTFLDLNGVEDRGARNAEALEFSREYTGLMPLRDNLVLAVHNTGISVLDLEQRTIVPLRSNVNLQGAIADPVLNRVWLAPPGQDRVGFLSLDDFHPDEVRLDFPVTVGLPMTAAEPPRFVAVHSSSIGHVTVLDGVDPRNISKAKSLQGFLVNDRLSE